MEIRKIKLHDNVAVAKLIRDILEDMGVPKVGTAYADKALDNMFSAYQHPKHVFFVADKKEGIAGCAGIAPLWGDDGNLCELQKMYVHESMRGKGLANQLLERCFATAIEYGFEGCYLETLPNMDAAQRLYLKNGFRYIDKALGNTGHHACSVRMLKMFQ